MNDETDTSNQNIEEVFLEENLDVDGIEVVKEKV